MAELFFRHTASHKELGILSGLTEVKDKALADSFVKTGMAITKADYEKWQKDKQEADEQSKKARASEKIKSDLVAKKAALENELNQLQGEKEYRGDILNSIKNAAKYASKAEEAEAKKQEAEVKEEIKDIEKSIEKATKDFSNVENALKKFDASKNIDKKSSPEK